MLTDQLEQFLADVDGSDLIDYVTEHFYDDIKEIVVVQESDSLYEER